MAADSKVSNRLVAVSCAGVLAVYAAGYSRTADAAKQFEEQSAERRPGSRERATTATAEGSAPAIVATEQVVNPTSAERETTRVTEPTAIVSRAPEATATETAANIAPTPATPATQTEIIAPAPTAPSAPAPTPVAPAPAPTPAPAPAPAAPAKPKWKDGTWYGWGTSRHGDIQAEVVIKDGKIVKSGIAQCLTRYSCDVIDILIDQPVKRQSPDVDFVSRATQSSDAYYYGLLEALDASTK